MQKTSNVLIGSLVAASLLLGSALLCTVAVAANDDPPGRVARVNLLEGAGTMQLAGTEEWDDVSVNRPLASGDKLWIEADSRAEMHIGSTVLRLGSRTAMQLLDVDDGRVRLRLTAGSLSIRIRLLDDDHFEIDTPAGEISIERAGGYRLDVDDRDDSVHLAVWSGRAEVSGPAGSRVVSSGGGIQLIAGEEPAIEMATAGATDDLDLWAEERDAREDRSRAAQYVSRDVVGYEELDGYGDWVVDPQYGSVWVPQVVAVDWAPYRYGSWSWIGTWGWTWIDDAPWGFAPCHYGRWVHARRGWAWAPGSRAEHRPVFAPALVAWHGGQYPGRGFRPDQAPRAGWAPLGFNEVYEPPFHASRDYWRAANRSNTRLGHEAIERYIDTRRRGDGQRPERRYVNEGVLNEGVPGAATTVSRGTFRPVAPVGRNRSVEDRPVIRPERSVFQRPVMVGPPAVPPRLADDARIGGRMPLQQQHIGPAEGVGTRQSRYSPPPTYRVQAPVARAPEARTESRPPPVSPVFNRTAPRQMTRPEGGIRK